MLLIPSLAVPCPCWLTGAPVGAIIYTEMALSIESDTPIQALLLVLPACSFSSSRLLIGNNHTCQASLGAGRWNWQ